MGKHLRNSWFTFRMVVIMFQGWIPGCIAQTNFCQTENEREIFQAKVKAINVSHFKTKSIRSIHSFALNQVV